MKIEDNKKSTSKSSSDSFKEFLQDKKTRWMAIAFIAMVVVTIGQVTIGHAHDQKSKEQQNQPTVSASQEVEDTTSSTVETTQNAW